MSKLISSTAVTADAVMEVGEWYVSEGEHDRASREQFAQANAMLLGRKTYQGLAGYWPSQQGPWADRINPMPKFVASRTLQAPLEWNATLLEGEVADAVQRLKASLERDVVLIGCGELARHLLAEGLVDELRFWVHPAVWGHGGRPLEGGEPVRLRLLEARPFDSGVTLLRYEPLRESVA
jgi:dihydrofolate reductase